MRSTPFSELLVVAFAGQAAGLIRDVQPPARIVKDMVAGAERAVELG